MRGKGRQRTAYMRAIAGKKIAERLFPQFGPRLKALIRDRVQNMFDDHQFWIFGHRITAIQPVLKGAIIPDKIRPQKLSI
ncbi:MULTISPECIES: hypothetical protein [Roseovarius]|uniref:hypothetical protein n=1 Tax=Roseovarius TaxID=74030 RepID=UPI00273E3ED4|nr:MULTISPECIES: hypothetical protein [unclassified Roseovarius]